MGCTPPSRGESATPNQSSVPQNSSSLNLKSNTTMHSNPTKGKALPTSKSNSYKQKPATKTIINKRSSNFLGLESML